MLPVTKQMYTGKWLWFRESDIKRECLAGGCYVNLVLTDCIMVAAPLPGGDKNELDRTGKDPGKANLDLFAGQEGPKEEKETIGG